MKNRKFVLGYYKEEIINKKKVKKWIPGYYTSENTFKYKCSCLWSKDDEHGFIPNTSCPAHGKETKKFLSKCRDIKK